MNGVIARSIFLMLALGICISAAVHWHEPRIQVVALGERPHPFVEQSATADQSLLLFIFSLKQGPTAER